MGRQFLRIRSCCVTECVRIAPDSGRVDAWETSGQNVKQFSKAFCLTFSRNILRFAPLICASLAGCSYNGLGTSYSAVIETGNTIVHELRGRGLHVATLQGTAIFSFGAYREILVFPAHCGTDQTGRTERQALIDTQTLAASVTDTKGLEIAFGRRWSGLTLGRHQAAVLVDVPQGTEIARSLHLDLNDLSATRIDQLDTTLCKKETRT